MTSQVFRDMVYYGIMVLYIVIFIFQTSLMSFFILSLLGVDQEGKQVLHLAWLGDFSLLFRALKQFNHSKNSPVKLP